MSTVSTVKRPKQPAQTRQQRQMTAVSAAAFRVITDRKTLAKAASIVKGLTDKSQPGALSLRDLASRTWRGRRQYGFWQHVARGSRSVKLTWLDWKELCAIRDLRESGVYANAALSKHVIAFQQYMALAALEVVEIARAVSETRKSE